MEAYSQTWNRLSDQMANAYSDKIGDKNIPFKVGLNNDTEEFSLEDSCGSLFIEIDTSHNFL